MIKPIKLKFYMIGKYECIADNEGSYTHNMNYGTLDAKFGLVVGENFYTIGKGFEKHHVVKRSKENPAAIDKSEYGKLNTTDSYAISELDLKGYYYRKQMKKIR